MATTAIPPSAKKTQGIMIDGQIDEEDEDISGGIRVEKRLADEVKAEAKSGVPADSKLVRDIRGRQVEQEAARKTENSSDLNNQGEGDESKGNENAGRDRKSVV